MILFHIECIPAAASAACRPGSGSVLELNPAILVAIQAVVVESAAKTVAVWGNWETAGNSVHAVGGSWETVGESSDGDAVAVVAGDSTADVANTVAEIVVVADTAVGTLDSDKLEPDEFGLVTFRTKSI